MRIYGVVDTICMQKELEAVDLIAKEHNIIAADAMFGIYLDKVGRTYWVEIGRSNEVTLVRCDCLKCYIFKLRAFRTNKLPKNYKGLV